MAVEFQPWIRFVFNQISNLFSVPRDQLQIQMQLKSLNHPGTLPPPPTFARLSEDGKWRKGRKLKARTGRSASKEVRNAWLQLSACGPKCGNQKCFQKRLRNRLRAVQNLAWSRPNPSKWTPDAKIEPEVLQDATGKAHLT